MARDPDYIIIGSGSAGSVLANRLTASGNHRVLLIEAGGPDSNPWIPVPLGMVRLLDKPETAWLDTIVPTQNFGGRAIPLPQGRTLGGSSSINGMLYVRGQRQDYDTWAHEYGCSGWAWHDVLPLFRRSECLPSGGTNGAHGRDGELKLSWITDISKSAEHFLQAAQDAGLPFNADLNDGDQDGVGYLLGSIHRGRRQSTARCFLAPAMARSNLEVRTRTQARRLVIEQGRAVGVEVTNVNGEVEVLRAQAEIISCSGAFGSPMLLQHSGIGPAAVLEAAGVAVHLDASQVGENLQDHLFGHLKYRLKSESCSYNRMFNSTPRMAIEALRWLLTGRGGLASTTSQVCGFFKSSDAVDRADLQLAMRPFSFGIGEDGGVGIDAWPGMTVSAIQTRPFSRGTVRIRTADPAQRGEIDTHYLGDRRDVDVLIAGMRRLRQIMDEPAIANLVTEETQPGRDKDSDEALERHLRTSASTVYHPVGTCRMGADADSVVDPALRVRGVDGLRIADGSIMPVITSGNTNAPCIMIGEKAADLILSGH